MKACQSEIISRERNLGRKRESERRRRRLKGQPPNYITKHGVISIENLYRNTEM